MPFATTHDRSQSNISCISIRVPSAPSGSGELALKSIA